MSETWTNYRALILSELNKMSEKLEEIPKEMHGLKAELSQEIYEIKTEIAVIKSQSSFYGAIAGFIISTIITLIASIIGSII